MRMSYSQEEYGVQRSKAPLIRSRRTALYKICNWLIGVLSLWQTGLSSLLRCRLGVGVGRLRIGYPGSPNPWTPV